MKQNLSEYETFTRYIYIWGAYIGLTIICPFIFAKLYCFVGMAYLIITDIIYTKKIRYYLVSNYPTECLKAMARRYPPDGFDGTHFKETMSLVAFNEGYRRRIFDPSDKALREIYKSNMTKYVFSNFMVVTSFLFFVFNYDFLV